MRKQSRCKFQIFISIFIGIILCFFGFIVIAWIQAMIGYPAMLSKIKELNAPYVIVKYEK
jgi:hypothetical protein